MKHALLILALAAFAVSKICRFVAVLSLGICIGYATHTHFARTAAPRQSEAATAPMSKAEADREIARLRENAPQ